MEPYATAAIEKEIEAAHGKLVSANEALALANSKTRASFSALAERRELQNIILGCYKELDSKQSQLIALRMDVLARLDEKLSQSESELSRQLQLLDRFEELMRRVEQAMQ